jgi:hypothetical protein
MVTKTTFWPSVYLNLVGSYPLASSHSAMARIAPENSAAGTRALTLGEPGP